MGESGNAKESKVAKQATGFKFGQHRLTVLNTCGEVQHRGRTYRLVNVRTHDGLDYTALRLYNASGKFIKQLLFEPEIASQIGNLILNK